MELVVWCVLKNNVHLIFRSVGNREPQLLLSHFNRFTSKTIVKAIQKNPVEVGFVYKLESTADYTNEKGLLENIVVFHNLD